MGVGVRVWIGGIFHTQVIFRREGLSRIGETDLTVEEAWTAETVLIEKWRRIAEVAWREEPLIKRNLNLSSLWVDRVGAEIPALFF